jgi:hypothetical protein
LSCCNAINSYKSKGYNDCFETSVAERKLLIIRILLFTCKVATFYR